jgi:thymidylate kinase
MFGAASQHVEMDAEQTLAGIMPVIQQMVQQMQQFKPKPDLTPDGQVLLQTSMAETQRRAARDQAEMALKEQGATADIQIKMQKMQQDYQKDMEELQLRLAIAMGDQEMQERIETARLTRDAAKLKQDGEKAVLDITMKQGGPIGY